VASVPTTLISPTWDAVLAIVLVGVGIRLITDCRRSRRTGVSHILFQWPTDFDRQQQPLQFWVTVSLATVVGYGLLLVAAACVVAAVMRLGHVR